MLGADEDSWSSSAQLVEKGLGFMLRFWCSCPYRLISLGSLFWESPCSLHLPTLPSIACGARTEVRWDRRGPGDRSNRVSGALSPWDLVLRVYTYAPSMESQFPFFGSSGVSGRITSEFGSGLGLCVCSLKLGGVSGFAVGLSVTWVSNDFGAKIVQDL